MGKRNRKEAGEAAVQKLSQVAEKAAEETKTDVVVATAEKKEKRSKKLKKDGAVEEEVENVKEEEEHKPKMTATGPAGKENSILNYFWALVDNNVDKRLAAAKHLLLELKAFQAEHKKSLSNYEELVNSEDTEERHNALCHPQVKYSIQRLIRGLPSTRTFAREGFTLALTELLMDVEFLTLKRIMNMVIEHTQLKNSASTNEERNALLGKMYGFGAIVRAELLLRSTTTKESLNEFADNITKLMLQKVYLHEMSVGMLSMILEMLVDTEYGRSFAKKMAKFVNANQSVPELLILMLTLEKFYPDLKWKKLFPEWKKGKVTHPDNLTKLAGILKESVSSHPNMNAVWPAVIQAFLPAKVEGATEETQMNLDESAYDLFFEFWRTCVEESLFVSTEFRVYLGMMVMKAVIKILPANLIHKLFTPQCVNNLIIHLKIKKSIVNPVAKTALDAAVEKAIKNPDASIALANRLMGKDMKSDFDRNAKTKVIGSLMRHVTPEQVQNRVRELMKLFVNQSHIAGNLTAQLDGTENKVNPALLTRIIGTNRAWCLSYILGFFNNQFTPKTDEFMAEVIDFMLANVIYKPYEKIEKTKGKKKVEVSFPLTLGPLNPPMDPTWEKVVKKNCISLFTSLHTIPPPKNTDLIGKSWLDYIVGRIGELEKLGLEPKLTLDEDQETRKQHLKALQQIDSLLKSTPPENKPKISVLRGFKTLFSHIYIQIFFYSADVVASTPDLLQCLENMISVDDLGKVENDQIDPFSVLIDVFLSFLAKESALWRFIITHSYKMFAEYLSKKAVNQLISVIRSDKIFSTEDVADEEEEDNDDDDEEGNGLKSFDGSDIDSGSEDDDSDDDTEDSEADKDSDDEEEDDEEKESSTKMKNDDTDDNDDDDDEDVNLDDVDEASLAKMDAQLTSAIKLRKQQRIAKKAIQTQLKYFRFKSLELLTIYIQKMNSLHLVDQFPTLMRMIITFMKSKETHQLGNKLIVVVNSMLNVKWPHPSPSDHPMLMKALVRLFNVFQIPTIIPISQALGNLCCLVVRLIFREENLQAEKHNEYAEKVVALYRKTLKEFMLGKHTRKHPTLIHELIKRFPHIGWRLFPDAMQLFSPTIIKRSNHQKILWKMIRQMQTTVPAEHKETITAIFRKALPDVITAMNNWITEHTKKSYKLKEVRNVVVIIKSLLQEIKDWVPKSEIPENFKSDDFLTFCEEFAKRREQKLENEQKKKTKSKSKSQKETRVKSKKPRSEYKAEKKKVTKQKLPATRKAKVFVKKPAGTQKKARKQ